MIYLLPNEYFSEEALFCNKWHLNGGEKKDIFKVDNRYKIKKLGFSNS